MTIKAITTIPDVPSMERAIEIQSAGHASNTSATYATALRYFDAWVDRNKFAVTTETVALYLIGLAEAGRKKKSLAVYRAAILSKYGSMVDASVIASTLNNIARERAQTDRAQLNKADPQTALPIGIVQELVETTKPTRTPAERIRNTALILLSWWGAFRCSEICALRVRDVEFVEGGMFVTIRRSKTDQEGNGFVKPVASVADILDPVKAASVWMDGYARPNGPDSPLFYGWDINRKPIVDHLTVRAVSLMLKRELEYLGYDGDKYSSHSFRSGGITWMRNAGINDAVITGVSGHKSVAALETYYHKSPGETLKKMREAFSSIGV